MRLCFVAAWTVFASTLPGCFGSPSESFETTRDASTGSYGGRADGGQGARQTAGRTDASTADHHAGGHQPIGGGGAHADDDSSASSLAGHAVASAGKGGGSPTESRGGGVPAGCGGGDGIGGGTGGHLDAGAGGLTDADVAGDAGDAGIDEPADTAPPPCPPPANTAPGPHGHVHVSVGVHHACAWFDDGTAKCWGSNDDGQLGDGTSTASANPVWVKDVSGVVQMALGERHTCARITAGGVVCWGANDRGQLGDGTTISRRAPAPVEDLPAAVEIASGTDHVCARLEDGTARCWGRNDYNQLGIGNASLPIDMGTGYPTDLADGGTLYDRATPVPPEGLVGAIQLTASAHHTCALLTEGRLACWGELLRKPHASCGCIEFAPGTPELIASGTSRGAYRPEAKSNALDGGCRDDSGDGSCEDGCADRGGDGACEGVPAPMDLTGAMQVAASASWPTFVLLSNRNVGHWWNAHPSSAWNSAGQQTPWPEVVLPLHDVVQIAAGAPGATYRDLRDYGVVCARLVDGSVSCSTPAPMAATDPFGAGASCRPAAAMRDLVGFSSHFCVTSEDDQVWCWDAAACTSGGCHSVQLSAPQLVAELP